LKRLNLIRVHKKNYKANLYLKDKYNARENFHIHSRKHKPQYDNRSLKLKELVDLLCSTFSSLTFYNCSVQVKPDKNTAMNGISLNPLMPTVRQLLLVKMFGR
jgi:hypothetical protein